MTKYSYAGPATKVLYELIGTKPYRTHGIKMKDHISLQIPASDIQVNVPSTSKSSYILKINKNNWVRIYIFIFISYPKQSS